MTERSAVHSSFVIERTFAATPARVFAAFADPEVKNRWFAGGDGWGTDAYQADFRVGGYEIYKGNHEGTAVTFDSRYYDIVADERIVFAYDMHMNGERISVSLTTVELIPAGKGTRLIFTEHDTFLDGHEVPGPREEGSRGLMDALEAELARQPVSS